MQQQVRSSAALLYIIIDCTWWKACMNVYCVSAEHGSHTLNVGINYANPVQSQKSMAESVPLPQLRCPFQDAQHSKY